MNSRYKKLVLLSISVVLISFTMIATDFGDKLSLSKIQTGASTLKKQVETHYVFGVISFILVYIAVNLWFPAAAVLTLLSGFLFGTIMGTVYVDAAATLGAVVAFAVSRNIAGKWIQHRWSRQLQGFNRAVSKYGYEYLLLVRMIPIMPYFMINFLAGLTKVPLIAFAWTTALGSLPGILIFNYAGKQLLMIESVDQVLTFNVIIAFVLLACFAGAAIMVRWALKKRTS